MTYEQALAYWFAHVNFEQRTPAARDLELERMRLLLSRLGDPHRRLRIIHLAGSKGKGSTSAMLASVLQQAGYRTGLFTSPHLVALEERFQVDGRPIPRDELAVLLTDIRDALSRGPDLPSGPPTFFEIATAAGFLHFFRSRADAVVLEVGLGGRLDSTNVCVPVLAVITSISFDHTWLLGDRLASIAREKAGIIKPGRPVVSGVTAEEARAVIEEVAASRHAPLRELGRDFHYRYLAGHVTQDRTVLPQVEVTTAERRWPELEINLFGEHQAANAAVAIASIEALREQGWRLPDDAVRRGLAAANWPARLELTGRRPFVVLDCAHNVASAEALVRTLQTSYPSTPRTLIFASSGDKDVAGMFAVFAPLFKQAFMTRYTSSTRAMSPEHLAALWRQTGAGPVSVCDTPAEALRAARQATAEDGLICITGSVFLAGEMRSALVLPGGEGETHGL